MAIFVFAPILGEVFFGETGLIAGLALVGLSIAFGGGYTLMALGRLMYFGLIIVVMTFVISSIYVLFFD